MIKKNKAFELNEDELSQVSGGVEPDDEYPCLTNHQLYPVLETCHFCKYVFNCGNYYKAKEVVIPYIFF